MIWNIEGSWIKDKHELPNADQQCGCTRTASCASSEHTGDGSGEEDLGSCDRKPLSSCWAKHEPSLGRQDQRMVSSLWWAVTGPRGQGLEWMIPVDLFQLRIFYKKQQVLQGERRCSGELWCPFPTRGFTEDNSRDLRVQGNENAS